MAVLNKRAIVTAIEMYGVTAIRLGRTLNPALDVLIKALFTSGEQGFAYDPNDLTTLYQDAAGTIPVTAAGQPVGLMLDKSKGLVLGSENVINGSLATLTSWEAPVTAPASVTLVAGGVRVYSPAGEAATLRQQLVLKRGGWYKVQFNVKSITGSGYIALYAGVSGLQRYDFSTSGVKTIYLQAAPTGDYLLISRSTICDFVISDVSVKELAGNHAYQTVSASRPILQQTPILGDELVVNGSFDTATGWTTYLATLTYANSRALIISTGSGGAELSRPAVGLAGKTVEVRCKFFNRSGGARATLLLWDASKSKGASKSSTASTGEISFVYAVPADFSGAVICKLEDAVTGSSVEFDDVSIKEVTGYRTDQNYLAFDGVDDFLQTNNIDFTATDKVSLFAGVRKLSDAATAILAELSSDTNLNNGAFYIAAPISASPTISFASKGTLNARTDISGYAAPTLIVTTMQGQISTDRNIVRVNGLQKGSTSNDQGTGNYGNYPLYIGRRGGTQLPFNGHLYSLIGLGRLTTDSETIALEKSIAKNTGVTLNV